MMRVRCILVETTVPVKIRPRMETRPVNGHFLSVGVMLVTLLLLFLAQDAVAVVDIVQYSSLAYAVILLLLHVFCLQKFPGVEHTDV